MKVLNSKRMLAGLAAALVVFAVGMVVLNVVEGYETPLEEGESPSAVASGGSTDEIIAGLQRKLEEEPEDFASHIALANAYLQKVRENGDSSLYTKAGDVLDRAEEIEPRNPELFAARGVLALARHEFAAAMEFGEEARASNPESARYHGIVGDAQVELGRYEEAVNSYQAMIDRRPDFESYTRVAHARELHGDPEGAIEAMETAIEAGSPVGENTAWAHVQLGNLRFNNGELDEAARDYDRSLKTFPDYPPALAGQARVAAARGELEDAAALYRRAFDLMPLPEHAIALGDVYAEMGDREKAEDQYEVVRAIDQLFQADGVNTDLEIALFSADHDLELQASLEKARSAYQARPSIHAADVLAWTLYKNGNYEEAQRYSSEALELGTQDPLKLFHAGMIAKKLGQDERAEEYLRQALDLNPRFSLLHDDTAAAELENLEEEASMSSGEDE